MGRAYLQSLRGSPLPPTFWLADVWQSLGDVVGSWYHLLWFVGAWFLLGLGSCFARSWGQSWGVRGLSGRLDKPSWQVVWIIHGRLVAGCGCWSLLQLRARAARAFLRAFCTCVARACSHSKGRLASLRCCVHLNPQSLAQILCAHVRTGGQQVLWGRWQIVANCKGRQNGGAQPFALQN